MKPGVISRPRTPPSRAVLCRSESRRRSSEGVWEMTLRSSPTNCLGRSWPTLSCVWTELCATSLRGRSPDRQHQQPARQPRRPIGGTTRPTASHTRAPPLRPADRRCQCRSQWRRTNRAHREGGARGPSGVAVLAAQPHSSPPVGQLDGHGWGDRARCSPVSSTCGFRRCTWCRDRPPDRATQSLLAGSGMRAPARGSTSPTTPRRPVSQCRSRLPHSGRQIPPSFDAAFGLSRPGDG